MAAADAKEKLKALQLTLDKLDKTYKSNVKKNKAFIKTHTTNFKNIALMSATDIILNMKPSDLMP